MPITKARRRCAHDAALRIEAGAKMLQYKLAGPQSLARLEDAVAHCEMLRELVEEATAPIRAAIWRTNTGPAEWLGPKRKKA